MLAIEKVIRILGEEDYRRLITSLENTRASKFVDLLKHYRAGDTDCNLHSKLQVSKNAFNVLKSRLYEKLQKFLINSGEITSGSVFINAINIPELIYKMDKDVAIAVLEGLEKEFKELDLPEYLTVIHAAQKKLFFNTSKFYHYSKLYNRSVEMQLALNKAEEELFSYKQVLGRYYHSGNKKLIQNLIIYKTEIDQLARLNESPRFRLIQNITNCSHAIHFPETVVSEGIIVDKVLNETKELICNLPGNVFTEYYKKVIDSLLFLFYCKNGMFLNASEYHNNSISDSKELINYSNLVCLISYLDEKIVYSIKLGHLPVIVDVYNEDLAEMDIEEAFPYIEVHKYNSMSHLIRGEYQESYDHIRKLFNTVSFKGSPILEIEIKFLYLLCSMILEKDINVDSLLGSISRKIKETDIPEYDKQIPNNLIRLFKLKYICPNKGGESKMETLYSNLAFLKSEFFKSLHKVFLLEPVKHFFLK